MERLREAKAVIRLKGGDLEMLSFLIREMVTRQQHGAEV